MTKEPFTATSDATPFWAALSRTVAIQKRAWRKLAGLVTRSRLATTFVRVARKPPVGQVRERWQNLWPLFASSLHQTGAAIRARISANPAQTRYAGSGIHLPSAPRNPGARDSSCLFIAHLCAAHTASPVPVISENVISRLHSRVAREPALGVVPLRRRAS